MRALALVGLAGCGFSRGHAIGDANGSADAPSGDARADAPRDAFVRMDGGVDAGPTAGIRFVQANNTEGTSLMSAAVPFTGAQTAGNLNVVFVGWYHAGTLLTVTDSRGNLYTSATGNAAENEENENVYYACNIGGAAAGTNTVTATFATSGQDVDLRVLEYSGIVTSGCLDIAGVMGGTGTAMDTGPIGTTHAHDLLVAGTFQYYLAQHSDASFTQRQLTGFGDLAQDRVVNAAASYRSTATHSQTGPWVISLAAFKGF